MSFKSSLFTLVITLLVSGMTVIADDAEHDAFEFEDHAGEYQLRLGARPLFLIDRMTDNSLKRQLQACRDGPFVKTDFSIGHRGAAMQFPEHTGESYRAAANMGAGILECDVTFTRDRVLVCRHAQCDLHTTTNILLTDLASKCAEPFTPYDPVTDKAASARCCTSDLTLDEFKSLQGKMDAADSKALTPEEYVSQAATAFWPSDLYTERGTLLTHAESIDLFKRLGTGMAPELKSPEVPMPFEGDYTQQIYAQQMIDEYKAAGVDPRRVWPQSFNLKDVLYWIENEPRFGSQAIFLDSRPYEQDDFEPTLADFESLHDSGVKIVAPPMFALLDLDHRGKIVASDYARLASMAGLDIITWTFERTDLRGGAAGNPFYYQSIGPAIEKESDKYLALDVLARQVKVLGIFTDWPATVTYYANCFGL